MISVEKRRSRLSSGKAPSLPQTANPPGMGRKMNKQKSINNNEDFMETPEAGYAG